MVNKKGFPSKRKSNAKKKEEVVFFNIIKGNFKIINFILVLFKNQGWVMTLHFALKSGL